MTGQHPRGPNASESYPRDWSGAREPLLFRLSNERRGEFTRQSLTPILSVAGELRTVGSGSSEVVAASDYVGRVASSS